MKVGGRYADREQTVRYSAYNWAVISETWAGSRPRLRERGADRRRAALHL
ncbi:hypothetical protein AB5I41_13060 [Sphingomonas sp. MMS24-JH45]